MTDRLDIANAREPHEAEARRRALAANNEAIDAAELRCYCPDDCNCRRPWRPNYCGCQQHEKTVA